MAKSVSRKELRQMELERYFTIKEAVDNWGSYSVIDKLAYIQRSFDQLNNYNSAKQGLNPNDTKFGFSSGINCRGMYTPQYNAVIMPFVMGAYVLNPKGIDMVLRHELRHRDQHIAHVGKTEKLYDSKSYKLYEHRASPIEKDADKSAYLGMLRANFTALIKSPNKVEAAKDLFSTAKAFVVDRFQHLSGRIAQATHGHIVLGKDKGQSTQERSAFISNKDNPPMFYSFAQLSRLVNSRTNSFATYEAYYKGGREGNLAKDSGLAIFKEYREATMPYHLFGSFFGTYNPITHERSCALIDTQTNNYEHHFDRYDKNGVLRDPSDLAYSFGKYTPQEVVAAKGGELKLSEEDSGRIQSEIQMVMQTALNGQTVSIGNTPAPVTAGVPQEAPQPLNNGDMQLNNEENGLQQGEMSPDVVGVQPQEEGTSQEEFAPQEDVSVETGGGAQEDGGAELVMEMSTE